MIVDHDLSSLPIDQAELWICLQTDAIRGQIMADQAERLGFLLVVGGPRAASMTKNPPRIFPTLNQGRA